MVASSSSGVWAEVHLPFRCVGERCSCGSSWSRMLYILQSDHRIRSDASSLSDIWPKPGDVFCFHSSVMFRWLMWVLMTFILIMSSVTMVLAVDTGHSMNRRGILSVWQSLVVFFFFHVPAHRPGSGFTSSKDLKKKVLTCWRTDVSPVPDDLEPGVLKFHDGTVVEGAEAQTLISTAVKNIHGLTSPKQIVTSFIPGTSSSSLPVPRIPRMLELMINIIVFILVYQGCARQRKIMNW